jgi:hypothetical protein
VVEIRQSIPNSGTRPRSIDCNDGGTGTGKSLALYDSLHPASKQVSPRRNNGVKTGSDTQSPFKEETSLVASETASADTRNGPNQDSYRQPTGNGGKNASNVTYR